MIEVHQIGNRQSKIGNALVRFLFVSRSGFESARHFSFSFLFLIGFLAGFDRGRNRSGLARSDVLCGLRHFADLLRGGRIKFRRAIASYFVILAGALTELLRRIARSIDALARRISNVFTQFLPGFRRKQQRQNGSDTTTNQQIRQASREIISTVSPIIIVSHSGIPFCKSKANRALLVVCTREIFRFGL